MDFFSRITAILTGWGVLCLILSLFAGIESDISGTYWAKLWWPRFLKIAIVLFILASLCFAFNF